MAGFVDVQRERGDDVSERLRSWPPAGKDNDDLDHIRVKGKADIVRVKGMADAVRMK